MCGILQRNMRLAMSSAPAGAAAFSAGASKGADDNAGDSAGDDADTGASGDTGVSAAGAGAASDTTVGDRITSAMVSVTGDGAAFGNIATLDVQPASIVGPRSGSGSASGA